MLNTSFDTYNVLHKILSKSIRCLYEYNNTLFDKIMPYVDVELYAGSLNMDLSYDAYMSNHYLNHSTNRNNFIANYHLSDMVFLHEPISPNLKKEDKVILRNSLNDCSKIICHQSLVDNWMFLENKLYLMNYGIPKFDIDVSNKTKSVIVINTRNNPSFDSIFGNIKQFIPDADLLKDTSQMTLEQIMRIVSQYKVCVTDFSIVDVLVASACGCFIVTHGFVFDSNIGGIFDLSQPQETIAKIGEILTNYNSNNCKAQSDYIYSQYEWSKFNNSMIQILQNIKMETFKI